MIVHFKFKGRGYLPWFILPGVFLVLTPVYGWLRGSSALPVDEHLGAVALAITGVMSFWLAAVGDRKVGIDVFSREAWTSNLLESPHVCFNLPMRLFSLLMLVVSLLL